MLLGSMFAAATLVLLPRFNAHKALKIIAAQHVTVFEGEADMYPAMFGRPTVTNRILVRSASAFGGRAVADGRVAPIRRLVWLHRPAGLRTHGQSGDGFSLSEVIVDAQNERFATILSRHSRRWGSAVCRAERRR